MSDTKNRITITVKSFATFREVMDMKIQMEVPEGATIRLLLGEFTGRYKGLDGLMFAAPGIIREYVNVLKNGRNIHFLGGLDTVLENGDVIALFPPLAGG